MKAHIFFAAVFSFLLFVFLGELVPQWVNHTEITNQKLNSVALIDDAAAIAVGEKGSVLLMSDRGKSWSSKKLGTDLSLNGVSVVRIVPTKLRADEENYASYIVGDGGRIYKLHKRVTDLSVDSDIDLKSVAFRNSVHGIAVGQKYVSMIDQQKDKTVSAAALHPANATIIVTMDGGKTWTETNFGVRAKFNSVIFVNKYRAIAVGDKGLLAISDDGGETWNLKNSNCSANFNSIKFCGSDMGIIVGDNGTLLLGSSAGELWENISLTRKDIRNLKSVCSYDGKTITVVGEGTAEALDQNNKNATEGIIMESADYGRTWTKVLTDQKGCFNYVSFCGKAFGLAVGNSGTIAVYTYEKKLAELHDLTAFRPKLNNNYPNPFNPSTRISYRLNSDDNVRISILNTLGEEIAVLVNEEKAPGDYEVEFNADNLSSGVYFYRIQSGRVSETKKMLLMR